MSQPETPPGEDLRPQQSQPPQQPSRRQQPAHGGDEAGQAEAARELGAPPDCDSMGWLPFAEPGSQPGSQAGSQAGSQPGSQAGSQAPGSPPPESHMPPDPGPDSFSPLAETVGSPVLPFPSEPIARGRPSPRVRLWALAALMVTVVCWSLWPSARSLAVEVRDGLGLRLVEGHAEILVAAARESGVEPSLLAGIMFVESHGRGGQTSSAGALGLMQLVPASAGDAARRLGLPAPTTEQLLEDDELNVRLGAAHVAWLLEHRGDWSLEQVLVSYNAGRAKLMRWMDQNGGYAGWRAQEERKELAGRRSTGALRYALEVLDARDRLLGRGVIPGPDAAPADSD